MADHLEEESRDLDVLEKLGYEPTDIEIQAKSISGIAVIFTFFIAFALGASWLFLGVLDRVDSFTMEPREPAPKRPMPPDAPVLQTNISATKDMIDVRKVEEEKLNALEPVEGVEGVYKIPVDKAMEIVFDRGLPTVPRSTASRIIEKFETEAADAPPADNEEDHEE